MKNLSLPQLCTIVERSNKSRLRQFLENRFSVSSYDRRYEVLDQLKVKTIFTTNIDDLLYKIYKGSQRYYLNDLDLRGPILGDEQGIDITTLHGSVVDPNRPFRFGVTDIASSFASDPDRWHYLTRRLQQEPTLFWGYSLNDAGTLEALNSETTRGRKHADKWIVVHPAGADDATLSFFEALDFHIIVADTAELLDYLTKFVAPYVTQAD